MERFIYFLIIPHDMDKFQDYLKKEYCDKEINFEGLLARLPYKKSRLYELLNELIKENKLVKIAEGIYKLKDIDRIKIPDEITRLSNMLKKSITRKFKFTALSVLFPFVHHTPYIVTYTIYVEKGSAEDFKDAILKIEPTLIVLLNPRKDDILLIINEAKKNKILVIRENNYFYSKEYGLAYFDTAFVDIYFEVSRDKIPFMKSDLKEILKSLVLKDLINYSRIMRYAHERKLTKEIKKILLDLSTEMKLPEGGLNVLQKIS